MKALLILLLTLAIQNSSTTDSPPPILQTGEGTVQGVVKRSDTGEPISDVKVTFWSDRNVPGSTSLQRRELTAITDSGGRFSFSKLPLDGIYDLQAERESYFSPNSPFFGGAALTRIFSSTTLDTNHKTQAITITLTPGGVVSGTVRDASGAPVSNVWVSALRMTYKGGRRVLDDVKYVETDDRGQYRLWGLPPDDYYIRADRLVECHERQSGLASVYFPGVTEPELAAVIKLKGGMESIADLQPTDARPRRISGRIINNNPNPASFIGLALVPREPSSKIDEGKSVGTSCDPVIIDGMFQLTVNRPGTYDVIGVSGLYVDRYTIDVRDEDVAGVTLNLERSAVLDVRVSPGPVSPSALANLRVWIHPVETASASLTDNRLGAIRNPLGRLRSQAEGLPDGIYAVTRVDLPPGVYIEDMRQGARSIMDTGAIVVGKTSAEPVELLLATGGGSIEGKISKPAGKVGVAGVSLIPQGIRRGNLALIKTVVVGGTFRFTDIPPGEYKLFAWESLPSGADASREFMSRYEGRGRSVTITAGSVLSNITLPLIEN